MKLIHRLQFLSFSWKQKYRFNLIKLNIKEEINFQHACRFDKNPSFYRHLLTSYFCSGHLPRAPHIFFQTVRFVMQASRSAVLFRLVSFSSVSTSVVVGRPRAGAPCFGCQRMVLCAGDDWSRCTWPAKRKRRSLMVSVIGFSLPYSCLFVSLACQLMFLDRPKEFGRD